MTQNMMRLQGEWHLNLRIFDAGEGSVDLELQGIACQKSAGRSSPAIACIFRGLSKTILADRMHSTDVATIRAALCQS
jgi:hypothetical protein